MMILDKHGDEKEKIAQAVRGLLRDRKGDEKSLSIWWFAVLAIIAGTIIVMSMMFYSSEISVKKIDADVLSNRILDCITVSGKIDKFLVEGFDLFKECEIDRNVLENEKYYVNISVYDSAEKLKKEEIEGTNIIGEDCRVKMAVKTAVEFPECVEKSVYVLQGNNLVRVVVLAGSNTWGGLGAD